MHRLYDDQGNLTPEGKGVQQGLDRMVRDVLRAIAPVNLDDLRTLFEVVLLDRIDGPVSAGIEASGPEAEALSDSIRTSAYDWTYAVRETQPASSVDDAALDPDVWGDVLN
jgi:hypothetical protein